MKYKHYVPKTFSKEVISKFNAIKNNAYGDKGCFSIPVFKKGELIAVLTPLTQKNLQETEKNREIVRLLAKWRKDNSCWFDVFKVTEQGTQKWLRDKVIGAEDRLLFLVETPTGRPFGHMGLFRGEADNFIRGEENVVKGGITLALQAMLKWAFTELDIKELHLRVLPNNKRAVILYERCNFKEVARLPQKKIVKGETIRWEEMEETDTGEPDRFTLLMYLRRKDFEN